MYILYNILILIVFFIYVVPYYTIRLIKEKGFKVRFKQSLGFYPEEELDKVAGKNCVWIHGASVGEIVATSPLVRQIKKEMPDTPVLVSAFTVGGYNMAKQIIPEADCVIFFPLDLPILASNMVRRIRPMVFMPVETELWPNFLRAINARNIPVMMVNGRISEKSVKTYGYLLDIWKDILNTVSRFCMQSSIDAGYIVQLGADKSKVFVTGNTKFDQTYAEVTPEDLVRYRTELGVGDAYPLIVAGSTHPGEEKVLFDAFKAVREKYPDARLLLAPRKVGRAGEIERLAKDAGFDCSYRSQMLADESKRVSKPVVLLDTLGELGRIYALGDIVFVGGSFSGTGGHNVLEPAAHAKPILVGPSMQNFKDSYALLSKVGGCKMVNTTQELQDEILNILDNPELREKMGAASMQVINDNRGADVKTINYLKDLLAMTEVPAREVPIYPINTRAQFGGDNGRFHHGDTIIHYVMEFSSGHRVSLLGNLLLSLLKAFSYVYRFGVALTIKLYDWGVLKRHRVNAFVISIGNITVGGTGKTPTAQKMAEDLRALGHKVVIINRGYRSHLDGAMGLVSDGKRVYMTAYEAGDEAYLMAKSLPNIPVVVGKDRAITGRYAVTKLHADVIIMDDGYQHWKLHRDLDVVLVDTLNKFGNGELIPRGTLREPLENLDRGDLFLFTKADQTSPLSRMRLREKVRRYNDRAPVVESIHQPRNFVEIADWYKGRTDTELSLEELKNQNVMVFSAIGNPGSFEQTLSNIGINILEAVRYPDHHDYGMMELQYLSDRAKKLNAVAIVATAKDAVKIPTEFIYSDRDIPLYILNMDIQITDGLDKYIEIIHKAIKKER